MPEDLERLVAVETKLDTLLTWAASFDLKMADMSNHRVRIDSLETTRTENKKFIRSIIRSIVAPIIVLAIVGSFHIRASRCIAYRLNSALIPP